MTRACILQLDSRRHQLTARLPRYDMEKVLYTPQHLVPLPSRAYGQYVTKQRRLAWPLHKDDTYQVSEQPIFCSLSSLSRCHVSARKVSTLYGRYRYESRMVWSSSLSGYESFCSLFPPFAVALGTILLTATSSFCRFNSLQPPSVPPRLFSLSSAPLDASTSGLWPKRASRYI